MFQSGHLRVLRILAVIVSTLYFGVSLWDSWMASNISSEALRSNGISIFEIFVALRGSLVLNIFFYTGFLYLVFQENVKIRKFAIFVLIGFCLLIGAGVFVQNVSINSYKRQYEQAQGLIPNQDIDFEMVKRKKNLVGAMKIGLLIALIYLLTAMGKNKIKTV